ncbi:MAG: carboxymethylenebutenolidase [Frankiales bacterium]|jgi:carboxymethylenebutenolidase|nr:carboxymethylenebutenolidase [Frankiales bacterium]
MTDDAGMVSFGVDAPGYLAKPASGTGPGIVVIQEWWGMNAHIRDVADRFAAEGFVALAPDLYHGKETREPNEAEKMMMGMAMDHAAEDIVAAADYLAEHESTAGQGIGVVGFCMGGSLALWSATLSDKIVATVGFYPAIPWERMSPEWSRYRGKAALLHADEHEGGINGPSILAAEQAIEGAGGDFSAYEYPGTDHAFFNDTRPEVYAPEAAALAWERTVAFLNDRVR